MEDRHIERWISKDVNGFVNGTGRRKDRVFVEKHERHDKTKGDGDANGFQED